MKKLFLISTLLLPGQHKKTIHVIVNSIQNCNCRMVLIINGKLTPPVYKLNPETKIKDYTFQVEKNCEVISVNCKGRSQNFYLSKDLVDTFRIDFSKNK